MKTRILTAIVAIALFVPICIFSDYIVFPIAISIICAVGVFEIIKCVGYHKSFVLSIPMYIIAAALPVTRFLVGNDRSFAVISIACAFFMLIYCMIYAMATFNKGKNVIDILSVFGLFLYVVGCFSAIVMVRYSSDGLGKYMYLLIFLGAWVSDTFAYFTGMMFKKKNHKLIPKISPKKTVEGAIGGVVFTLIAFIIYGIVLKNGFAIDLPIYQYCILGVILPIVSQVGDLLASTVKRHFDIKDYGKIFPGHGGVLDRFDSVMLVAPTLCIINAIINLITGVYVL